MLLQSFNIDEQNIQFIHIELHVINRIIRFQIHFCKGMPLFSSYLLYKSSQRNHLARVLIAADVEVSETLVGSLLFLFPLQIPLNEN